MRQNLCVPDNPRQKLCVQTLELSQRQRWRNFWVTGWTIIKFFFFLFFFSLSRKHRYHLELPFKGTQTERNYPTAAVYLSATVVSLYPSSTGSVATVKRTYYRSNFPLPPFPQSIFTNRNVALPFSRQLLESASQ